MALENAYGSASTTITKVEQIVCRSFRAMAETGAGYASVLIVPAITQAAADPLLDCGQRNRLA